MVYKEIQFEKNTYTHTRTQVRTRTHITHDTHVTCMCMCIYIIFVSGEEAASRFMDLSPIQMKSLLYFILSGKEFGVEEGKKFEVSYLWIPVLNLESRPIKLGNQKFT